jgi:hypothetical protein
MNRTRADAATPPVMTGPADGLDAGPAAVTTTMTMSKPAAMPGMMIDTVCKADDECRAVDVTCEACRCMALHTDQPAPTCRAPKVTCVVAPCMYKRAVCKNSACVLVDESPNSI